MTFEQFLETMQRSKTVLCWDEERTTPAIMALGIRMRLERPLKGQCAKPSGMGLIATHEALRAQIDRAVGAGGVGQGNWRTVEAAFDDMVVAFHVHQTAMRTSDAHWHAAPIRMRTVADIGANAMEGVTNGHPAHARTGDGSLEIAGGAEGLAAFGGFVAAMAAILAPELAWGPISRREGFGGLRLEVQAERDEHIARCVVTADTDMGGSWMPLWHAIGTKSRYAHAMQHVLAKVRPFLAPGTATGCQEGDRRSSRIVVERDVPHATASASLGVVWAKRREQAFVDARSYLRSMDAPVDIVEGLTP